jgi:hypothetical protein
MADRDRSVREAAVAAMGAIGPAAKQALPYLKQYIATPPQENLIMTPEEMKEMTREQDYRRLIKDAIQKIER